MEEKFGGKNDMNRVNKTTYTNIQNTPGHYLILPGSNSVWMGFQSEQEAKTCLLVLPDWKYLHRE